MTLQIPFTFWRLGKLHSRLTDVNKYSQFVKKPKCWCCYFIRFMLHKLYFYQLAENVEEEENNENKVFSLCNLSN